MTIDLKTVRQDGPVRDQGRADQARQEDLARPRRRRSSTPAAATPTGSPPSRARASSCSASSPSPRARRVMEHPAGVAGMPAAAGIAARLEAWLAKHADAPGAGVPGEDGRRSRSRQFTFEPDAFVHELVDSIIGDNYPVPDRMLVHNERIVHEYLSGRCAGIPSPPASSTSTRSRAARRRCATSSSRSRPTACCSPATPSRWARRSSRPTSR